MKAIVLNSSQFINSWEWFAETEIATPIPEPRDLLIRVKAISINPGASEPTIKVCEKSVL